MSLYMFNLIQLNSADVGRNLVKKQHNSQIHCWTPKGFSIFQYVVVILVIMRWKMMTMCNLVCPQQAQVSHPELVPSAQPVQPALFSSPLYNGTDPGAATTVANLDKSNPCQLALQAQSQVQSQIPVLQPSDSQQASSGSASSSVTQQKPLGSLTGAAETNTEVLTHDSLFFQLFSSSTQSALKTYQYTRIQYHCFCLSLHNRIHYLKPSLWLFVFRIKPQRNTLQDRAMTGTCFCRCKSVIALVISYVVKWTLISRWKFSLMGTDLNFVNNTHGLPYLKMWKFVFTLLQ